jgi:hypothetical protein
MVNQKQLFVQETSVGVVQEVVHGAIYVRHQVIPRCLIKHLNYGLRKKLAAPCLHSKRRMFIKIAM